MPTSEGQVVPLCRFAIVAAKFNREVVERLVAGALAAFRQQGLDDRAVDVVWVPGSFEIPLTAQRLAASKKYAAIVGLGAVIRGDTDHYDHVCRAAADGILQAGLTTGVPVIFGVLTCQTEEQAYARAGGPEGNKGADAARAALEMAAVMRRLDDAGE
ncbi:MAG: 6,7-dimethyl-8-ribityllumazine synthase [Gemmataceae bacterium]|nr:6,7-dimethyl-8-ribityllumazine synthase [Gemmataceae bacterium]